jgi:hypothetical protein
MSLAVQELPCILHMDRPLAGAPCARWSFLPSWVGVRLCSRVAARALELVGGASDDEVDRWPRSTASRGGGEASGYCFAGIGVNAGELRALRLSASRFTGRK